MYHSALKGLVYTGGSIDRFECANGVAFKNNVCAFQPFFEDVDVVYAEPAWRPWYKAFKVRAGDTRDDGFNDYVLGINRIIVQYDCPVYIVCGKHFLPNLLPPTGVRAIKLLPNNSDVIVLGYNVKVPSWVDTTFELMDHIAAEHNCVYDFSCGYDEYLLRKFFRKKFYLSDLDGKCISYIKQYYQQLKDNT